MRDDARGAGYSRDGGRLVEARVCYFGGCWRRKKRRQDIDTSFKETATKLDTIRSHLSHQGQEIANLEGSHDVLEKEIESLKDCLNERDKVIAELCGVVEFLTNKRCQCNDDKVSPCCYPNSWWI